MEKGQKAPRLELATDESTNPTAFLGLSVNKMSKEFMKPQEGSGPWGNYQFLTVCEVPHRAPGCEQRCLRAHSQSNSGLAFLACTLLCLSLTQFEEMKSVCVCVCAFRRLPMYFNLTISRTMFHTCK